MIPSGVSDLQIDLGVRRAGVGAPILLIHGTAAPIWGELPGLLAGRGEVVTYARRGFAGAAGEPGATLTRHAEDAAHIIEGGPAALLVGWSMGGVIALEVALRQPGLVSGLVLLEPPLHAKRHPRPRMLRAIGGATIRRRRSGVRSGASCFLDWALRSREGPSGLARLSEADCEATLASADAILDEIPHGTGEHLARAELAKIGAPTEVLAGTLSDPVFAAGSRRVASWLPNATISSVGGAAHAIQLDAPHAVVDAVDRVLRRVGASS